MSPTFSRGRGGRAYRYYVSASLQQGGASSDDIVQRLPAPALEKLIAGYTKRWLPKEESQLEIVDSITLGPGGVTTTLAGNHGETIRVKLAMGETIVRASRKVTSIRVPLALPLRGGRRIIVPANRRTADPDLTLIAALRKAHRMVRRERGLPVIASSPPLAYDRKILMLAFLAPGFHRDILVGKQPPMFNLEWLTRLTIPLDWHKQRQILEWPERNEACSDYQIPCYVD